MRRAVLALAAAVLLGGPTVLAFFAGGYFDGPRAAAAVVAWTVVLVLALVGPLPLPRSVPGWFAVGGLLALTVWSAISIAWAPLHGPAVDNVQRLLIYLGVLIASLALLRDRRAARAAEPALAFGALLVIGYGLSGRLLPGLIELARSTKSGGRLEQPITYWNAEGLLAAIGLVLCVRIAGDRSRPALMRAAAASASTPLGLGVYLSYSRGALAVAVIGMIVLLAATPSWPQFRAVLTCLLFGAAASVCAAVLPGVAALEGTAAGQRRDGAIMLVILLALMLGAALVALRAAGAERRRKLRLAALPHARRLPAVAAAATVLCVLGLVIGGLAEDAADAEGAEASPSRFTTVQSIRYEYWRVGLDAFADQPIQGVGSGGFRVAWRMERSVDQYVVEAHSLVLGTAAELGLPGLLFLGLFLGGIAAGGRSAIRRSAPAAAGGCAVCLVWLLHAAIDWDLQLPAVTLPAVVLAGGLLAASELSRTRREYERTPQDSVEAGMAADVAATAGGASREGSRVSGRGHLPNAA